MKEVGLSYDPANHVWICTVHPDIKFNDGCVVFHNHEQAKTCPLEVTNPDTFGINRVEIAPGHFIVLVFKKREPTYLGLWNDKRNRYDPTPETFPPQ